MAEPSVALHQIRQRFRANWRDLVCTVEDDSSQWTLRVQDAGDHILYTAYRGGRRAAQVAAAEFAAFRVLGPASGVSPERLAMEFAWQQSW
jgi:hypothetical protein